jgi:hypothetical protein
MHSMVVSFSSVHFSSKRQCFGADNSVADVILVVGKWKKIEYSIFRWGCPSYTYIRCTPRFPKPFPMRRETGSNLSEYADKGINGWPRFHILHFDLGKISQQFFCAFRSLLGFFFFFIEKNSFRTNFFHLL